MPRRRRAQTRSIAEDTLGALATTVRAARERKRWTLAARADRSIGTLIRIANAFGVGVWELFASPADAVKLAAPADALTLWRSPKGGTAVLLVGAASPQPIELWQWRLAPGDVYKADAHLSTTVEVIHVQQGTLSLVVAKKKIVVGPGASVVARMD